VDPVTVYISIGNSDDKLTQAEWHRFYVTVARAIRRATGSVEAPTVHGQWVSEPASAWQNACWCIEPPALAASVELLKLRLAEIAAEFGQDSIAWAEAPVTEFIGAVLATEDTDG
jgi:hypothetical protein